MLRRIISLGLLVASLMTSCINLQAQGAVKKGDFIINAGVGVFSPFTYAIYGSLGYKGSLLPAFQLSGESIIGDIEKIDIGVGASLGFQHAYYNNNNYHWRSNNVFVGFRAIAHFGNLLDWKKGDLYAGLQFGPRIRFDTDNGYNDNRTSLYFYNSYLVGARYFLKPNFGLFAEVGYDIAYLKAGISLKL